MRGFAEAFKERGIFNIGSGFLEEELVSRKVYLKRRYFCEKKRSGENW